MFREPCDMKCVCTVTCWYFHHVSGTVWYEVCLYCDMLVLPSCFGNRVIWSVFVLWHAGTSIMFLEPCDMKCVCTVTCWYFHHVSGTVWYEVCLYCDMLVFPSCFRNRVIWSVFVLWHAGISIMFQEPCDMKCVCTVTCWYFHHVSGIVWYEVCLYCDMLVLPSCFRNRVIWSVFVLWHAGTPIMFQEPCDMKCVCTVTCWYFHHVSGTVWYEVCLYCDMLVFPSCFRNRVIWSVFVLWRAGTPIMFQEPCDMKCVCTVTCWYFHHVSGTVWYEVCLYCDMLVFPSCFGNRVIWSVFVLWHAGTSIMFREPCDMKCVCTVTCWYFHHVSGTVWYEVCLYCDMLVLPSCFRNRVM